MIYYFTPDNQKIGKPAFNRIGKEVNFIYSNNKKPIHLLNIAFKQVLYTMVKLEKIKNKNNTQFAVQPCVIIIYWILLIKFSQ